jgi:hypothetical protein
MQVQSRQKAFFCSYRSSIVGHDSGLWSLAIETLSVAYLSVFGLYSQFWMVCLFSLSLSVFWQSSRVITPLNVLILTSFLSTSRNVFKRISQLTSFILTSRDFWSWSWPFNLWPPRTTDLRSRPWLSRQSPEIWEILQNWLFLGKQRIFLSRISVRNHDSPFTELVHKEAMEIHHSSKVNLFSHREHSKAPSHRFLWVYLVRLDISHLCLLIEWRIQGLGFKIEPKQI